MEMIRHDSRAWDPNWKNLKHYNNYFFWKLRFRDEAYASNFVAAKSLEWDRSGVPEFIWLNIAIKMRRIREKLGIFDRFNGPGIFEGFNVPGLNTPSAGSHGRRRRRPNIQPVVGGRRRRRPNIQPAVGEEDLGGIDGLSGVRNSVVTLLRRVIGPLDFSTFGRINKPKRVRKRNTSQERNTSRVSSLGGTPVPGYVERMYTPAFFGL